MTFSDAQKAGYNLTKLEYNRLTKESVLAYEKAYKDVKRQIENLYLKVLDGVDPKDYYNYLTQYNRLTTLMDGINKSYIKASLAAGATQKEASRLAISNAYYRQLYTINWTVPADGVFVVLNPSVIEVSVLGTEKVWQSISSKARLKIINTFGDLNSYQPQYGTLTDILIKNRRADIAKLKQAITSDLIQGKSFAKMTKSIRDILNTSRSNAERIAVTEGHRNMMAGNNAMTQMARTEGVEVRRQIISVIDGKERDQSTEVNHRKEDKDGFFTYPGGVKVAIPGNSGNPAWDIRDRESVINNVNDVSPQLTRAKNPLTGENEIISFKDFDKWTKKNDLKRKKSGRIVKNKK